MVTTSVSVVTLVPVVPFRWFRWFRWFRSGGFAGSGGSVPVVTLVPVVPFRWFRSVVPGFTTCQIELLEDKQQLKPVKQAYHYHKWLRNGGITSLFDLFLIVNSRKQVFPDNCERSEVLFNCFCLLETFLKCLIFFVLHPEMIFLIDSIIFECACSNEQLLKVFKISYDQPTVKL